MPSHDERFWRKVTRTPGCWIWTGSRTQSGTGYGQFWTKGRLQPAHRVAWEFQNGLIPAGKRLLHRCDNKPCVRPSHLFLGSQSDNLVDMVLKGRRASLKLTPTMVREIRSLAALGLPSSLVSRRYRINPSHARHVASGRAWAHVR
jgi:hypothetical protein